ncbi:T9SS type A sorting domain-containing protein [Ferruginibacter sp.]
MKKIFTLLSCFIAAIAVAQSPVNWQTKIGGTDTEYANAVDTSIDGNIFAAGFIRSRTGDYIMQYPGPDVLSPDAWIVKYNKYGIITWQKCFGGTNADEFFDVKATGDGGAVAVGRSGSTDGDINNNKGGEDIIVVKYDADGNIQWHQNYGTTLLDGARIIIPMTDGSYVLGCYSNGNNKDLIGGKGGRDIWLLQISSTGTIIRTKNFGGSAEDDVFDLKLYNTDNWVFTGSTGSINGDVTGNHGSTDVWVVKLDANWNLVKQKCFGSTGGDIGNGVVVLPDGFAIAARAAANNGDVSGLKGAVDGWLIKTTNDLTASWMKTFGGSANDWFYAMSITQDGNLLAAGETSSTDGDISSNAGVSDAWLLKVDVATGNKIWSKTYGETKGDRANDIVMWGNDDYLFAGQFGYVVPNSTITHAQLWIVTSKVLPTAGPLPVKLLSFEGYHDNNSNILLWQSAEEINSKEYVIERAVDGVHFDAIGKVAAAGNSSGTRAYKFTDNSPAEKSYYRLRITDINGAETLSNIIFIGSKEQQAAVKLYPSITTSSLTVQISAKEAQPVNITIINTEGQVMYRQTKNVVIGINKLTVDVSHLPAGNYYLSITQAQNTQTTKFIKY